MTNNRSLFSRILNGISTIGRAGHAVENGRTPAPSDLERIGISVVAFGAINKN